MIKFKAKTKTGEYIKSGLSSMNFPAGEAHTKLDANRELEPTEIAIVQFEPDSMHDDLFKLAMWEDYLLDQSPNGKRVVIMPYLPGARADRGAPFGAQVYARFLASLTIDQLIVVDPHSPVFLDEYRYLQPNIEVTTVYSDDFLPTTVDSSEYAGVIAPDKGAVMRTQKVVDAMGLPMFRAGKTRNPDTGKLSGFHMEDELPEGRFLIVDDICDGGGTFLGLYDSIHDAQGDKEMFVELDLFVTHGVFSKDALYTLPNNFGKVITTNSYNPQRPLPAGFKRIPLNTYLLRKVN